ncbi:MmcQ/YjbR family DNA-binding protein [Leptospira sarikeiensis]|uniref:MmcQ/YjbR family DNA-binding protein n=1 Tax=Leptospira sarikeiensis TaxID=2484943 RepID=A0A4R9KCP6_9LEPT|nr:MmcQ/YjbR family DNA-binding protein [Leptospira sarikeiensis]TGL64702.1 MmcQ/YjbR family DNA-binding protein [Leptospira sarikeiensis]
MISIEKVRKLALSLPEAKEEPHFEKTSFRIKNKIFATVDAEEKKVVLKFNQDDQDFFTSASKGSAYPIDNKWGQQGWTCVEMKKVDPSLFKDMLIVSYYGVASKKLKEAVKGKLPSYR